MFVYIVTLHFSITSNVNYFNLQPREREREWTREWEWEHIPFTSFLSEHLKI